MAYYETLANELGISLWIVILIVIWSGVWKLIALWKSARKGSIIWFICLALINIMGILEILYIFVFSEWGKKKKNNKSKENKKKRR